MTAGPAMRIAVTGGSGCIGAAVVELAVARGHSVVSIDRVAPAAGGAFRGRPKPGAGRPAVEFVKQDITQYSAVERTLRGCHALVHLAAIPAPGGRPDHEVHHNNVVGSYNVLRAAAQLGITRICQASSVNATGLAYSRWPRYDYFPIDEHHPTYNEDPYSLSKWICEQQADSLARRYEAMAIASLRFHWVVTDRAAARRDASLRGQLAKTLWGYTHLEAAARACVLSLTAEFSGHQVFYVVAPDTMMDRPSLELRQEFFPEVPVRADLGGRRGFFDCGKAERLLRWRHDAGSTETG